MVKPELKAIHKASWRLTNFIRLSSTEPDPYFEPIGTCGVVIKIAPEIYDGEVRI